VRGYQGVNFDKVLAMAVEEIAPIQNINNSIEETDLKGELTKSSTSAYKVIKTRKSYSHSLKPASMKKETSSSQVRA
jgi:hypothetical protein